MAIGRNAGNMAVAGCVLVWASLTILPLGADLFALSDDDSSITLGATLVKPYQYSDDAKEFTVGSARESGVASKGQEVPVETMREQKVEGDDGTGKP